MRKSDITSPEQFEGEVELDQTLRPSNFGEFFGQEKIVNNLKVFITAAKKRKETLDHVLLTGPPGLGKTTLAHIIANEIEANIKITSGPSLDKPYNLAGILTNLQQGDVLFIDEIHRLNPTIEEYLYPALEDFVIDIVIDSGPNARNVQLKLPKFTLVAATTRAGLLTSPLRSRFGVTNRLDYYDTQTLQNILMRSANILDVEITRDGLETIASRSRGTPRIANRLIKRCRDFAQADKNLKEHRGVINNEVADYSLQALEVDSRGLDDMDKRIILTIVEKFDGGPVGLTTLASAVSEDPGTIEEVYEPYLIQEGFIQRTPRGRVANKIAYEHFSLKQKQITQTGLEFK